MADPSSLAQVIAEEQMIAFCREEVAKAERAARSRRDAAKAWSTGTEEDHRDAHRMAQRQAGRKWPYQDAVAREKLAAIEERIAAKCDGKARMYTAIADRLAALEARAEASVSTNPVCCECGRGFGGPVDYRSYRGSPQREFVFCSSSCQERFWAVESSPFPTTAARAQALEWVRRYIHATDIYDSKSSELPILTTIELALRAEPLLHHDNCEITVANCTCEAERQLEDERVAIGDRRPPAPPEGR